MKINGPGESTILLLKIIKLLNKLNFPYAVIGAFAASFYGHVRASLDADAPSEKSFFDDVSGGDLDIPGSELDDAQEEIGSEDEENNGYSMAQD